MEFKTSISKVMEKDMILRGESHADLIANASFSDTIFLLLLGRKPNEKEARIFNTILVSAIDHGMGTPSAMAARFVMSGGNALNTAVAGGVLALGDYHGGAIENAMRQLTTVKDPKTFVAAALEKKERIFGFGHKVFKESDPRTLQLLEICKEIGLTSQYLDLFLSIEEELERQKGKKIILNIDGAIAAILLEMGFTPLQGKGIFVIARTPGLVAHAVEEAGEPPVRRIREEDITYLGTKEKFK